MRVSRTYYSIQGDWLSKVMASSQPPSPERPGRATLTGQEGSYPAGKNAIVRGFSVSIETMRARVSSLACIQ